jgi:steroid delta-isomerase-like uncharacterized protein
MSDLKALSQRMYEGMAAGADLHATAEQYMAEDFVDHEIPGPDSTREAAVGMLKAAHAAFPDFRMEVVEMLQDGDKVVARLRMRGTHQGEFMGIPASGNQIDVAGIDINQWRDGKCIAHWGVTDFAAMMQQIGDGAPA